jgi:hypothetical protein
VGIGEGNGGDAARSRAGDRGECMNSIFLCSCGIGISRCTLFRGERTLPLSFVRFAPPHAYTDAPFDRRRTPAGACGPPDSSAAADFPLACVSPCTEYRMPFRNARHARSGSHPRAHASPIFGSAHGLRIQQARSLGIYLRRHDAYRSFRVLRASRHASGVDSALGVVGGRTLGVIAFSVGIGGIANQCTHGLARSAGDGGYPAARAWEPSLVFHRWRRH